MTNGQRRGTEPVHVCVECRTALPRSAFRSITYQRTQRDGSRRQTTQRSSYCEPCERTVWERNNRRRKLSGVEYHPDPERRRASMARVQVRLRMERCADAARRVQDVHPVVVRLLDQAAQHGVSVKRLAAAMGVTDWFRLVEWGDPVWVATTLAQIADGNARHGIRPALEERVMAFVLRLANDPDWWDRQETTRYSHRLTPDQVRIIRNEHHTNRDCAAMFGVTVDTVQRCRNWHTYRTVY